VTAPRFSSGCFWENLRRHGDRPAVIDVARDTMLTYRQIAELTDQAAARFGKHPKKLVYLAVSHEIDSILCYLTFLIAGHAVYLCGENNLDRLASARWIERYRPDIIVWRDQAPGADLLTTSYDEAHGLFNHRIACRRQSPESLHADLAVLLSTSGSTGSSKTVRLSARNVQVNACQIAAALRIEAEERIVVCLPLQYAYGLSVLNSALTSGSSLIIGARTVMQPGFWSVCRAMSVTALPVVPAMLQFMQSLPREALLVPSLRKLTIAGSAMDSRTRDWLISDLLTSGIQIFPMYGMTEASARISVLPSTEFADHPDSAGRVIPAGELTILPTAEIVYRGENVMMGYAQSRSDLALGDLLHGVLHTGDLGRVDEEGNLYICGRLNRICKVLGLRVDLASLERELSESGDVAVTGVNDVLTVFYCGADTQRINRSVDTLARRIQIPRAALSVRILPSLPRTSSGKISYPQLEQLS
jgi:long-chain acyl-CoA synthetase